MISQGFARRWSTPIHGTKTIVGLEGGLAGLGIRGVVPIALAGKHLGSVEFGLSFGQSFFDEFKRARGVDVAFHLAGNGEFKTFGGTLNGQSFFDRADYRGAGEGTFLVRQDKLGATPVAALLGPIKDFSGKSIGVVEIVMDNTEYVSADGSRPAAGDLDGGARIVDCSRRRIADRAGNIASDPGDYPGHA